MFSYFRYFSLKKKENNVFSYSQTYKILTPNDLITVISSEKPNVLAGKEISSTATHQTSHTTKQQKLIQTQFHTSNDKPSSSQTLFTTPQRNLLRLQTLNQIITT